MHTVGPYDGCIEEFLMSMRHSIFRHENEETGVVIHIFEDFDLGAHGDNRLEVEFTQGTINVPWPREAFEARMLELSRRNV
jgi:hypothetical protein